MQGTPYRRLATYAGEKYGLVAGSLKPVPLGLIAEIYSHEIDKAAHLSRQVTARREHGVYGNRWRTIVCQHLAQPSCLEIRADDEGRQQRDAEILRRPQRAECRRCRRRSARSP